MFSRFHSARAREAAFTLAELLITIVIIGIIMAIAVPLYTGAREGAKVKRLQTDVTTSAANVGAYYNRYGVYPDATTFNTKVAVVSAPSEEALAFKNPNSVATSANQSYSADVCVVGTATIGSKNYIFSYNLAQKKLVAQDCTYVGAQAQEPVQ